MSVKTIIGIDPGKQGGFAAWVKGRQAEAWKMPATEADIWELFCEFSYLPRPHIFLEKVHARPRMRPDGMMEGMKSAWTFAEGNGVLRGMIIASGIPSETVTPAKWLGSFNLRQKKGETKTAWKNRHKAMAQELFPHISVTHPKADALLIMEYGRRTIKQRG